jgi:hypothetical protein
LTGDPRRRDTYSSGDMAHAAESEVSRSDGPALSFAVQELERVAAPTVAEFTRRHLRPRRAVVLTGLTDGWLPAREWTMARMAARHGDARVIAARLVGGRLMDDSATSVVFHRVALREFVAGLAGPDPSSAYVMAPTWNFAPTLQAEYRVPPYCVGAAHLRAKVWLGKAGTVTPMHRDVPHNLHVHLTGRKRWLLVPSGGSARVYPRGLLSDMPNFSEGEPEPPDTARQPRARDATVFGATLAPGETLFIPHGWWHHTRSLDDAVSMNFWWGGPIVQLASLASTAFKRMRGIRRDEWG